MKTILLLITVLSSSGYAEYQYGFRVDTIEHCQKLKINVAKKFVKQPKGQEMIVECTEVIK